MITLLRVAECLICPGFGELIALKNKLDDALVFYCPACETAWEEIPNKLKDIKSLEDVAPSGVVEASPEDLLAQGIIHYEIEDLYNSIDDLIGPAGSEPRKN